MKTVVLCGITLLAVAPAFAQTSAPAAPDPAEENGHADRLRRRRRRLRADYAEPGDGRPVHVAARIARRHRHRFPRRRRPRRNSAGRSDIAAARRGGGAPRPPSARPAPRRLPPPRRHHRRRHRHGAGRQLRLERHRLSVVGRGHAAVDRQARAGDWHVRPAAASTQRGHAGEQRPAGRSRRRCSSSRCRRVQPTTGLVPVTRLKKYEVAKSEVRRRVRQMHERAFRTFRLRTSDFVDFVLQSPNVRRGHPVDRRRRHVQHRRASCTADRGDGFRAPASSAATSTSSAACRPA